MMNKCNSCKLVKIVKEIVSYEKEGIYVPGTLMIRLEESLIDVNKIKIVNKDAFVPPSESEMIDYFRQNGYGSEHAKKVYRYYSEATPPWTDSSGKPVLSWKSKCLAVWFRDEGKIINQPRKKTEIEETAL